MGDEYLHDQMVQEYDDFWSSWEVDEMDRFND